MEATVLKSQESWCDYLQIVMASDQHLLCAPAVQQHLKAVAELDTVEMCCNTVPLSLAPSFYIILGSLRLEDYYIVWRYWDFNDNYETSRDKNCLL